MIPPTPTPTPIPTPTAIPATAIPQPTPTPTLPPGWQGIAPGLDLRALPIPAEGKSEEAQAILLRVDLAQATLRVHYSQDDPATVANWQTRLGALAVINAGFFQENYLPAGLLAADGVRYGISFDADGLSPGANEGMFAVNGDFAHIRALSRIGYDPAQPLDQAVQGLPTLLDEGAWAVFDLPDRAAWRTAVAVDRQGRVILLHVSGGQITLTRLQAWLRLQPDLDLIAALNLDGGPSTGMVINAGAWQVVNDSVSKVPSVIAIYPR